MITMMVMIVIIKIIIIITKVITISYGTVTRETRLHPVTPPYSAGVGMGAGDRDGVGCPDT